MIKEFQDEYCWLSNFWPIGNVERRYQAAKFSTTKLRMEILATETPGQAKRLARKYKHLRRKDWHQISLKLMKHLLREKFKDGALRAKLISTGNEYLQEGNTWGDVFWGVDLRTGKGENHLGRLLMEVREEIRATDGGSCD